MAAAVLFMAGLNQAHAAEVNAPEVYVLETVYVTADKLPAETETAKKASISVKDKIDAGQIKGIPDLLRDAAGFTVAFNPGAGTEVTVRGLSGERFLVAVNGNVQQNQGGLKYGRGLEWDMIPLANVQKIEIIRGASSAAYAGTWGGVVNIVTIEDNLRDETSVKFSYGDYATKKATFSNQGSDGAGRFSWSVAASQTDSDGYYRNNWRDDQDVNLNLQYRLNDEKKLSFSWTHGDKEEGVPIGNRPGLPNGYDPDYPATPPNRGILSGSYRTWDIDNYALHYATASTKLSLFQNEQYREEWFRTGSAASSLNRVWQSDLTNRGLNWEQELVHNRHKLTYGVQYQGLDYELITSGYQLTTGQPGVFVQDYWQAGSDVVVGLGARYDRFDIEMEPNQAGVSLQDFDENYAKLTPKLSVTKKLKQGENIFAGVSSVFRPPTAADYSRWGNPYFETWDSSSAAQRVANDLGIATRAEWQQALGVLEPESGWSYEIGWSKKADDRWGWRVTGFYNEIDDYIYNYFPSAITSGYSMQHITYNAQNAVIKGIELSADYVFNDRLSAVLAYTNQHGEKDGDWLDAGTEMSSIPEHTVNFGLRHQNGNLRTALDTRYVSERENLGGYVTSDLSFMLSYKKSAFSLSILNIFDKEYAEYEGWPMPGRTYSVSWQYKL